MMMVFTVVTPVFGSEVPLISASNNSPYKENFKNKWHHTIEKNGGRHYLYYAYDTSLVKEDVAYADSKGYRHRSKIVNARGTHSMVLKNGPIKGDLIKKYVIRVQR